jgi:hypothetical protein
VKHRDPFFTNASLPGPSLAATALLLFPATSFRLCPVPLPIEAKPMDDEIDTDRIDDTVLALLLLGLHDGMRAWKGLDWDTMDRLHR